MSYINVPKEIEEGKNYADEIIQNLIKEHNGKIEYRWKYESDRRSYSLYLNVERISDSIPVIFYTRELADKDSRTALANKLRNAFKSLSNKT